MKTTYKNLLNTALGALVCAFLAVPASAQHRPSTGGGGGGGGSSSGGGGGSFSRPSAPPPSFSRPQSNNSGFSRPASTVAPRPAGQAQQSYGRPATSPRVGVAPRSTYSYGGSRPATTGVRGNYGYAPRTYDANHRPATGYYRSAPRVGYGHGGYWGNHNYYHYNRGYYRSYYYPRIGFSIGVLPYGYYPFFYGDYQYYYSDGLFYQYDNNEYTVVEPPIGAEVKELPDKAQSIVINGQQYYELNGVYYQPVTKDDGSMVYQVAGKDGELNTTNGSEVYDDQPQGPQMGDIVSELPPDCRKIKVNGDKLFVSPDGVYYKEMKDDNGDRVYKVVGLPSDEDQPEQN
ncbi:DUF6515 family protein [Mucilaginibacter sp. L3T2-6]|uniref:DUF6515 family protein n=1 Tax=Mucilaginibacter sp. L3T2-6 TaxID=3062491 RepID=UPI00267633DF|nr:DUF6515 family protein [Mucilaginibacter sp. L3T2-6]MDO3643275.1 hypothetical protein [Mucilaginibacter sp. L3T2-6]MDV6215599.1 DUF6515 family protein [Mucilaginibacter sp. L3T2-6]